MALRRGPGWELSSSAAEVCHSHFPEGGLVAACPRPFVAGEGPGVFGRSWYCLLAVGSVPTRDLSGSCLTVEHAQQRTEFPSCRPPQAEELVDSIPGTRRGPREGSPWGCGCDGHRPLWPCTRAVWLGWTHRTAPGQPLVSRWHLPCVSKTADATAETLSPGPLGDTRWPRCECSWSPELPVRS